MPVAVTNWFDDQPFGVWPCTTQAGERPDPLCSTWTTELKFRPDHGTKPDLIIAVNAGLDADTYQEAHRDRRPAQKSGGDAFSGPGRDQAHRRGTAVFQADTMRQLITDVDTVR